MDYIDFYYTNVLGYTPENMDDIKATSATIAYLQDCGLTVNEVKAVILACDAVERLTPADLPDTLWSGSLTRRDRFYYHHALQITSKPPHYDAELGKEVIEPYFLEIKARYAMQDLIHYFYTKLNVDIELMNEKRDSARMASLLKKYEQLSFVSSLDFVLSLIDYAAYSHQRILSIFDIEKNETEVFEELKRKAAEASFHGKNVIVWRN